MLRPPDTIQGGGYFYQRELLGDLRINVNTQFTLWRSVYGRLFQNQFPQAVLFGNRQNIVVVQDVLGGRDDLHRRLVCLGSGFFLSHKLGFRLLQLLDFSGEGCISLGEHINGVHTLFKIIAESILLLLETSKLCLHCFQCGCYGIDFGLALGV